MSNLYLGTMLQAYAGLADVQVLIEGLRLRSGPKRAAVTHGCKQCNVCKAWKPVEQFRARRRVGGVYHQGTCKACEQVKDKARKQAKRIQSSRVAK